MIRFVIRARENKDMLRKEGDSAEQKRCRFQEGLSLTFTYFS